MPEYLKAVTVGSESFNVIRLSFDLQIIELKSHRCDYCCFHFASLQMYQQIGVNGEHLQLRECVFRVSLQINFCACIYSGEEVCHPVQHCHSVVCFTYIGYLSLATQALKRITGSIYLSFNMI